MTNISVVLITDHISNDSTCAALSNQLLSGTLICFSKNLLNPASVREDRLLTTCEQNKKINTKMKNSYQEGSKKVKNET